MFRESFARTTYKYYNNNSNEIIPITIIEITITIIEMAITIAIKGMSTAHLPKYSNNFLFYTHT